MTMICTCFCHTTSASLIECFCMCPGSMSPSMIPRLSVDMAEAARAIVAGALAEGISLDDLGRLVKRTNAIARPAWPHDGTGEEPGIPRFGADEEVR